MYFNFIRGSVRKVFPSSVIIPAKMNFSLWNWKLKWPESDLRCYLNLSLLGMLGRNLSIEVRLHATC